MQLHRPATSFSILFEYLLYQKRIEKSCLMMIFVAKRMLFSMVYCRLNLLLVFISKCCFFWERLHNLLVLTTWPFCKGKKCFLNYPFLLSFHDLTYFEQITQKELNSCVVSVDDGWCSCKLIVLAKDFVLQKFHVSNLFD